MPPLRGALDRVLAGLVDGVGHGLVLDGVGDLVGRGPLVADHDLEALVEEGVLADPGGDRLEAVGRGLEGVRAGPVGDRGAGLLALLQRPDLLEVGVRYAELEGLAPQVAPVLHVDDQPGGQRVDDRDAHAVQATGHLVAAAAELAAGVEHRQRHGHGGDVLAGGGVGRDAATVVLDPDPAVGLQRQHDPVAVTGERLVDRVVDDLPDQVVQAALAGGADVHARPLADGLESFEDLDRGGVVLAGGLGCSVLGLSDCSAVTRTSSKDVGSPRTSAWRRSPVRDGARLATQWP